MRPLTLLATLSIFITSVTSFASPKLGSRLLTSDENEISYPPMTFSGTIDGQTFSIDGDVRDAVVELHRRFPQNPKFDPTVIEREIQSRAFNASLTASRYPSSLNDRDDGFVSCYLVLFLLGTLLSVPAS